MVSRSDSAVTKTRKCLVSTGGSVGSSEADICYNLFDLQGFPVNLWMSFWVFFVWKDKLPNFKFGWCFSKHAAAIFWSFSRPLEELEVKFTWRLTPKQKIMHTKWMNIWGSWWCFAHTMGIPSFSMTQRPRGRWTNPKTPWGTSGGVHTCWPFQRDSWWLVGVFCLNFLWCYLVKELCNRNLWVLWNSKMGEMTSEWSKFD